MVVAVVHFMAGHAGTKRSPNVNREEVENVDRHVVAAAKLRLGMLLKIVAAV